MTELEQKIDYLIKIWEEDNQYKSNIDTEHIAYKALVSLGDDAIPYLLKYLGRSWIVPTALYTITDGDVYIPPEERGSFNYINDAWRAWAKEKGLI